MSIIFFKYASCEFYVLILGLLFWLACHLILPLILRISCACSLLFTFLASELLTRAIAISLSWHLLSVLIEISFIIAHLFFAFELLFQYVSFSGSLGCLPALSGSERCHWRAHVGISAFFCCHFGMLLVVLSGLFVKHPKLVFFLLRHIFSPFLFARFLHGLDRSLKLGNVKHTNPLE